MNETYNELVADLKVLANSHKMVAQTEHGQIADLISTSNFKYPLIYFLNEYVQGNNNGSYHIFKMHILAASTMKNGLGDMLEVQSDMLGILQDICSKLQNASVYRNKYAITQDIVYYPFFERFDDNLTGYRAEVYIRVGINKNPCESAFE